MDSRDVDVGLRCNDAGILLTATIARTEQFRDAVLKNVIWRPRIDLEITPFVETASISVQWRMRATETAKEIRQAKTPPYPLMTFPLISTQSIRSR